jgi:hypothetical protein
VNILSTGGFVYCSLGFVEGTLPVEVFILAFVETYVEIGFVININFGVDS